MAVRRRFSVLLLLTITMAALSLRARDNPQAGDALLGEWWTENNEGRIKITRDKAGFYRGTTKECCECEIYF